MKLGEGTHNPCLTSNDQTVKLLNCLNIHGNIQDELPGPCFDCEEDGLNNKSCQQFVQSLDYEDRTLLQDILIELGGEFKQFDHPLFRNIIPLRRLPHLRQPSEQRFKYFTKKELVRNRHLSTKFYNVDSDSCNFSELNSKVELKSEVENFKFEFGQSLIDIFKKTENFGEFDETMEIEQNLTDSTLSSLSQYLYSFQAKQIPEKHVPCKRSLKQQATFHENFFGLKSKIKTQSRKLNPSKELLEPMLEKRDSFSTDYLSEKSFSKSLNFKKLKSN